MRQGEKTGDRQEQNIRLKTKHEREEQEIAKIRSAKDSSLSSLLIKNCEDESYQPE